MDVCPNHPPLKQQRVCSSYARNTSHPHLTHSHCQPFSQALMSFPSKIICCETALRHLSPNNAHADINCWPFSQALIAAL